MRILITIIVIAFLLGSSVFYTVDQRAFAIIVQFGDIKRLVTEPGLHIKIPFLQKVIYFDKRIQTLDSERPDRFITSEKKNVLVDSFVKWRIVNPERFYVTVFSLENARLRLGQTVNSGLREEFGKRTIKEVISGQRDAIMQDVGLKVAGDAEKMGIKIVDVRLRRVELPNEVSDSVYRRMRAERERVANELRALGAAEAEKIRASADRQKQVILSKAYATAQQLKAEGDAKAGAMYSAAYGRDPAFYSFYKSLEAYRLSFKPSRDYIVLDAHSNGFYKYLDDPQHALSK